MIDHRHVFIHPDPHCVDCGIGDKSRVSAPSSIETTIRNVVKLALTETSVYHFPVFENGVLLCGCGYRKEGATRYDWGDHIIEAWAGRQR